MNMARKSISSQKLIILFNQKEAKGGYVFQIHQARNISDINGLWNVALEVMRLLFEVLLFPKDAMVMQLDLRW